ncbi:hypothetical protein [Sinimarinibacterium thermocellulolyticum]|uniref:Dicarboxylate transport domain-containing protein n=1 Tax=Sinimarinibacterium thermocellulolyticum TaxID=3170016 RepID=A0ABV2A9I7_9GAMM
MRAPAHHAQVYRILPLLALILAAPAAALERIEVQITRIDGSGWQLRDVRGHWQAHGRLGVAGRLESGLPARSFVELSCAKLQARGLACDALRLRARNPAFGSLDARGAAQLDASGGWRLQLRRADVTLQHNSADGRLAAENLRLGLTGEARHDGKHLQLWLQAATAGGLAYIEPYFVDFGAQPLHVDVELRQDGGALRIEHLAARQTGVGSIAVRGALDPAAWGRRHELFINAAIDDAASAATLYAQPALTATPLQGLALAGALELTAHLRNAQPLTVEARLRALELRIPRLGVSLDGLHGKLAWATATQATSQLRWSGGQLGRLPLGPAQLQWRAAGAALALSAPTRIPLLDGSVDIDRLAVSGIGGAALKAEFAARLQPIDLRELCRAFGWPAFSGTLSGHIPGLRLHDRRIELDGALTADAFGGEIRIGALGVTDPFGVLPRVSADIQLRRLDLAALTGAFDFGRITGRLDGDITGLRLIGWAPVAMDAHLYSTPGDRSPRRISQRAIDDIAAVGGGPTGLLSRGVMRFFDDFAYRRIGWRCVLDDGICRMDGIRPSDEGDGYVLVEGRGLPRIDVVGYSRRVSWPVFMAQLRSIGNAGAARVDTP